MLTSGNHIWDKKEVLDYIGTEPRLLRPANYPAGVPGRGACVARTRDGRSVGVINVMGRVFMPGTDDPFAVVLREIEAIRNQARVILVDMHGEATSEKMAMGWHLDGKVTLVVGTHTHVQTADERILPQGTAYLTDAGMTGPHDSIIGMQIEPSLSRFLTAMPSRFEPASANPRLNGVVVSANADTGTSHRNHADQPLARRARRAGSGGARRGRAPGTMSGSLLDLFDEPRPAGPGRNGAGADGLGRPADPSCPSPSVYCRCPS